MTGGEEDIVSKQQTTKLYGIAILLMLFHHLFLSLDMGYGRYVGMAYSIWGYNPIVERAAWFCKICVAIYAFITGYGIASKYMVETSWTTIYKGNAKAIFRLYKKYWLVLAIFLPLGLKIDFFHFSPVRIMGNFLGLISSYDWPMWYVRQYLILMLFAPVVLAAVRTINGKLSTKAAWVAVLVVPLAILCINAVNVFSIGSLLTRNEFIYLMIFCEGAICKATKLLEIGPFEKKTYWFILALIVLIRVCVVKEADEALIDTLLIVPFCLCCVNLFADKCTGGGEQLYKLGLQSTYMWMIHFFIYYVYLGKLIYALRNPILIFAALIFTTYCGARVLSFIEQKLSEMVIGMGRKKN